jgi:DNA-directed RNA polymerase subunit L/DNA-directed RNA polymerase alpha subunit
MASSLSIDINGLQENNGIMSFTLSGTDLSVANAIRRSILSDIPTVVFRTFGEHVDVAFSVNTSRLNNEILGQRLSCIPIHISPDYAEHDTDDMLLVVEEANATDVIQIITTDNFRIQLISTGEDLSKEKCRAIFKPFVSPTGDDYYIQFARLRPRISPEIPGERLAFKCKFSVGTASENSMFNVVGTCAYGMTVDDARASIQLEEKVQKWKSAGMTDDVVARETANWELLDKKRITLKNSFDFVVGTVGPIPNSDIVSIGCRTLIQRCRRIIGAITDGSMITSSAETSNNSTVEYTLENEDYTIGSVLNYLLYQNYYEGSATINFCGFKKMHPHDTHSIIRLMFKETDDVNSTSNSTSSTSDSKSSISKLRSPNRVATPADSPDSVPYAPMSRADADSPDSVPYAPLSRADDDSPDSVPYAPMSRADADSPDSVPYSTTEPAFQKGEYSPPDRPLRGGGQLNQTFRTLGFEYIKKCCNDAIEIFETIERLISRK